MFQRIPQSRFLSATIAATGAVLLMSGCDATSSEPAAQAETTTQADAWVLTSVPEGAVSITEAKATAKEGDQVIIKGRIGGRMTPISADSPVFLIVDLELEYCGQFDDDGCPTPWDYCCETPNTITTNSATVQIMGDGAIDPISAGLNPLDEIVLIGTVGPRPDSQVLTIKTTGIYRTDG